MATLIRDIIDGKVNTPSIAGMKVSGVNTEEQGTIIHLILKQNQEEIHVPLVKFANELSKAFEETLTSTALCFVADASSGLGTEMVARIVNDCNAGMVSTRVSCNKTLNVPDPMICGVTLGWTEQVWFD